MPVTPPTESKGSCSHDKHLDKTLSQGWAEILASCLSYSSISPQLFAHPGLVHHERTPSRTNLALDEIIISVDLQDVAGPAADVALGAVVPAGAAGAVQHRVLDLQPLAVGGFAGVVDTAGRETRRGGVICYLIISIHSTRAVSD